MTTILEDVEACMKALGAACGPQSFESFVSEVTRQVPGVADKTHAKALVWKVLRKWPAPETWMDGTAYW